MAARAAPTERTDHPSRESKEQNSTVAEYAGAEGRPNTKATISGSLFTANRTADLFLGDSLSLAARFPYVRLSSLT